MKHGVVVASPRAGITRDKYSANKSSHHSPRRPHPHSPSFPLLPPCYLQNVARGGLRGRRQFLTSRAVYRRWPPTNNVLRGGGGGRGTLDVFDARFISCHARAHAFVRSLSHSFFAFSPFCACFTLPLDFFRLFWSTLDCSATTNQDHLTGNTPRTRHRSPLVSAAPPPPPRLSFLLPFLSPPSRGTRRRRHRHTFTDQFVR